jgi:hypothetical protein
MGPPPQNPAATGPAKVRHAEIFDNLDTNKDGKVSAEELSSAKKLDEKGFDVSEILELADTDGDGSISEDENDVFLTTLEEFTRSMMRGVSAYDGKGKQQVGGTGGVVDATM